MKKSMKKLLSGIVAISMLSSTFSMFANAADMTYENGKIKYVSDKVQTAVLLRASYDGDKLKDVVVLDKEVKLNKGDNYINVSANKGDKIFLWDSMKNISPLSNSMIMTRT